jgi:hypothetical protein
MCLCLNEKESLRRMQREDQAWWFMPVISATQEVEGGESWSKASPGQKHETLSENELKEKGLGL